MQRMRVGLRIDRDGAQPEAPRRARDADGDLAAIGNQDGGEHARARERWWSMIPKSGFRFSETIMRERKAGTQ